MDEQKEEEDKTRISSPKNQLLPAFNAEFNILSPTQQLDLMVLYLRRVHAYCFYCGEEYDDERMVASKCGPQHIRNCKRIDKEQFATSSEWEGSKNFVENYT
jgi:hypothetical protein